MDRRELRIAGWICLVSAVITMPAYFAPVALGMTSRADTKPAFIIAVVILLGFFIAVYTLLKRLLNIEFGFHGADPYIITLIWIHVVSSILVTSTEFRLIGFLWMVSRIAFAVVLIVLAISIKRIFDRNDRLLELYPYSLIIAALFYIALALLTNMVHIAFNAVALLVVSIPDLILALTFLQFAEKEDVLSRRQS